MDILKPCYYDEFECIGEKCTSTCCAGWDVLIDDKTYEVYQKLPGEFGEKLRASIDRHHQFIMRDGICSMLDGMLCSVYKEIGPENMCETCKIYPREALAMKELIQLSITSSCPEVARMIMARKDKITYELIEEESNNIVVNHYIRKLSERDKNIYFDAMSLSIDLMQMEQYKFYEKAMMATMYAIHLQKCMDRKKYGEVEKLNSKYQSESYLKLLSEQMNQLTMNEFQQNDLLNDLMGSRGFKIIIGCNEQVEKRYLAFAVRMSQNPEPTIKLFRDYHQYMAERIKESEQIYIHNIFESYMRGAEEDNMAKMVVLNNVGTIITDLLGMIYWYLDGEYSIETRATIYSYYMKALRRNQNTSSEWYRFLCNEKYNTLPYQISMLRLLV